MTKPILISGIQPTGQLHLGNYLGALKNFVALQNSGKYSCYFFVADLHSLTENFTPQEKTKQILDLAETFLAAGLNPKKSVIFLQSAVPAHSELTWIMETITPLGELNRMTQFKDKSGNAPSNINAGLFAYPTLMAADILLYDAKFVPVGEDQDQHLELARALARKFNAKFGKTFIEPLGLHTNVPRLMSLENPNRKMSKSHPAGCLFIDDGPEVIRAKIARAATDSGREIKYKPQDKPGVSNLLLIYLALNGKSISAIENKFKNRGYAEFKRELTEVVVNALKPFQAKKKELSKKPVLIKKILAAGNKKANNVALKKLLEVKKKIGLII